MSNKQGPSEGYNIESMVSEYDTEPAYEATEALFKEDDETVEEFIEPLDGESSEYDEKITSAFNKNFKDILTDYDAENDVHGFNLAEDFVVSESYDEAEKSMKKFETRAADYLEDSLGDTGVIVNNTEVGSNDYKQGIIMHSLRRLVEGKYNHEPGEGPVFKQEE